MASADTTAGLSVDEPVAAGRQAPRPEAVPAALLAPVVAYFEPWRVILFGSRARGEAGPDSDWDLLVILDDDAPPERLRLAAGYAAVRGFPWAADVVPCRRAWFEAKRRIVNSLAWMAEQDGVVVYERH